ncbi:MAG: hypothetical protein RL154_1665 [Pseudomonadota bacterium]|jgi:CopG family nickel-responsive transcriptional regulator
MSKKQDSVARFTLSMDESLLEYLDKRIDESGYPSRSEYVRDLIRQTMVDDKWDSDKEAIGVLTIVYDHHHRDLADKMVEIFHTHLVNVVCNLHVHITHDNCLETIILRGKGSEISRISQEVGGLRGVRHSSLSKTAAFE